MKRGKGSSTRWVPETVPEILRAASQTFEARNAVYGDAYKRFGSLMRVLFPEGLPPIQSEAEANKLGVLCQMFNCFIRFTNSGMTHRDSMHDLIVFAAMMEELTP